MEKEFSTLADVFADTLTAGITDVKNAFDVAADLCDLNPLTLAPIVDAVAFYLATSTDAQETKAETLNALGSLLTLNERIKADRNEKQLFNEAANLWLDTLANLED